MKFKKKKLKFKALMLDYTIYIIKNKFNSKTKENIANKMQTIEICILFKPDNK